MEKEYKTMKTEELFRAADFLDPLRNNATNVPWIPWFDNVKEAENFCMGPIGDENRLIDKAKKDFIRRSAKIRKSELRLWMKNEGEK